MPFLVLPFETCAPPGVPGVSRAPRAPTPHPWASPPPPPSPVDAAPLPPAPVKNAPAKACDARGSPRQVETLPRKWAPKEAGMGGHPALCPSGRCVCLTHICFSDKGGPLRTPAVPRCFQEATSSRSPWRDADPATGWTPPCCSEGFPACISNEKDLPCFSRWQAMSRYLILVTLMPTVETFIRNEINTSLFHFMV